MPALPNTPDIEPEETEETAAEAAETDGEVAEETRIDVGVDRPIERRIEALIDERAAEIERQIDQLEAEVEELDDFARISLGERYSQRLEQNVSELSDSLTGFAERNFEKMNSVEKRVDEMSMILSAVLEALDEEDVDVDLSDLQRLQERRVLDRTPEEQLQTASSDD